MAQATRPIPIKRMVVPLESEVLQEGWVLQARICPFRVLQGPTIATLEGPVTLPRAAALIVGVNGWSQANSSGVTMIKP